MGETFSFQRLSNSPIAKLKPLLRHALFLLRRGTGPRDSSGRTTAAILDKRFKPIDSASVQPPRGLQLGRSSEDVFGGC